MEEIPCEIVYRNGLDHTVPDCLSRTNRPQIDLKLNNDDDHFESRILAVDVISNDEWNERIRVAQKDDKAKRFAVEQLQENHEVRMGRFKRYKNVHLEKGILMQGKQIVGPMTLHFEIVAANHKEVGHSGTARTIGVVAQNYCWSGMHSYIEDFCAHCQICIKNKCSKTPKEPLQPYTLDELQPRNIIAFDVATLPWATQYRYFLVIVDLFSKYCELAPTKDQHAQTIEKVLLDFWIHRHGCPNIAVSDQAHNIDGNVVRDLCTKWGIEKCHS